jgi:DNA-binding cell septation regulator SpoVG
MGSIAIMTRPQGGYRLVYPTRKIDGKNLAIYHPITKEQSQAIEEAVIKHYEEVLTSGRYDSFDHD